MKSKLISIFVIFVIPLLYFYDETVATTLTALVASGFAAGYAIEQQKKRQLLPAKLLFTIGFIVIAWLLLVGRSVWVSCSVYASWPVFIKLCSLLLLTCSIAYELAINPTGFIAFYRIAALTGLLQGIMAIAEYIEAPPIPATWLDPASKELFRTRCCGIMTDPNLFAAFMSVLFILTIALIIRTDNKKEQIMAAISLIFCGTGIFMTLSRGGWVALVAALIAYGISLYIARKKLTAFATKTLAITAVLLLIVFFSGPFKYRLFSITKPSDMTFAQRTLINKGIFASLDKLPVTGHGIHTFIQVYPLYRAVGGDYPMYAHNEYLQSLIETGFLSSLLLMVLTFYLLRIAYKSAKNRNLDCIAFSSAFISLLVQNLSGFSSRMMPTSVLIAITIGAMLSSQFIRTDSKRSYPILPCINYSILALSILVVLSSANIFVIQNKFKQANQYLASGDINSAAQKFEEILRWQPDNSSAASTLGMIMLIAKQPQKAAEIWEKASEQNKYEANFPISLARLYASTNPELSEMYYQKALELDPASENFRVEYAKFLISLDKKSEAKAILEKGLTYSPGFHNVYKGFLEIEQILAELGS